MRDQVAHRCFDTSHYIVAHTVGRDLIELLSATRSLLQRWTPGADLRLRANPAGRLAPAATLVDVPKEHVARYAFGDRTVRWRGRPDPRTRRDRRIAEGSPGRGLAAEATTSSDSDVTAPPDSALTKGEATTAPPEVDVEAIEGELTGLVTGPADAGRHRPHRSPARGHALKVLYGDDEWVLVVRAAQMLGLRPSSYVAAAALSAAQLAVHPPQADGTGRRRWAAAPAADRELLLELMQARAAVNRYGVNVNQAVAALHSLGHAPPWLEQAVAGARRAVGRVDEAAGLVARRLNRGTS